MYTLPLTFVRERAARTGEGLRLLPPYREHLSQAFARYCMRGGLPQDIPPFRYSGGGDPASVPTARGMGEESAA